ncbi:hypothetical protein CC80DRAFT_401809, partial [Byssothecium circinans]
KNLKTKRPCDKLDNILEVKGLVTYRLELLKGIYIYPIFYKLLLKLALLDAEIKT